ncbi:LysM peptidoglycan-binding domain-containing protein [Rathayibacter festucae]|uniref:LysM peptidoglycan-binding domain-containing protein n=1 Tax=Rathayibacter festucae TaxID=110937 RepID=A0ABX6GY19_9MICO|nr:MULTISPECIES: LysM peptidoglycan-binding domain-containing protein [Rathayibacter]QHC62338.1 LysM peptidoglycan-binding domain-containing protein [Rathayibacter festucae]ROS24964.1 LysM domain-containing protein [Rathayibacter sp. PhB127]
MTAQPSTIAQHQPSAQHVTAAEQPGARTRLRLTRRGRAVLATLGALPLVAGAFVFGLNGGGAVASGESADVEFQYVTVRAGESLWSLAEELAPDSDPRDVVYDIQSLNQLANAGLEPGQRLAIPAQYDLAD